MAICQHGFRCPPSEDQEYLFINGRDAIVVFVDSLSKMVHFAATATSATADTARIFRHEIFGCMECQCYWLLIGIASSPQPFGGNFAGCSTSSKACLQHFTPRLMDKLSEAGKQDFGRHAQALCQFIAVCLAGIDPDDAFHAELWAAAKTARAGKLHR